MKVYIGPYVNWIGPYQIAEKLMFWANKYEDERVFAFGKWLAENKDGNPTLLNKFCSWIHSKKNRKIKVKIDGYDTWSLDETLCHVIHPLLVEFRKYPGGIAATDMEDIPGNLHDTYDGDYYSKQAYMWIIDEMIWAFDPEWEEKYGLGTDNYQENASRRQNGFRLFGKYLTTLWN